MSSRRILKKEINASFDMLYTDCVLYTLSTRAANIEKTNNVLDQINEAQEDLIKRVSATEGKDLKIRIKAYYKKIRMDLKAQINKIGKDIQNLD